MYIVHNKIQYLYAKVFFHLKGVKLILGISRCKTLSKKTITYVEVELEILDYSLL